MRLTAVAGASSVVQPDSARPRSPSEVRVVALPVSDRPFRLPIWTPKPAATPDWVPTSTLSCPLDTQSRRCPRLGAQSTTRHSTHRHFLTAACTHPTKTSVALLDGDQPQPSYPETALRKSSIACCVCFCAWSRGMSG
jgi:hypothetical protein